MIQLSCPGCQAKLKVGPALAGKAIKCPKCAERVSVPPNDDEPAEVVEPDLVRAPKSPSRKGAKGERATVRSREPAGQGKSQTIAWIVGGAIGMFVVLSGLLAIVAYFVIKSENPKTEVVASSAPVKPPTPEVQKPGTSGKELPPVNPPAPAQPPVPAPPVASPVTPAPVGNPPGDPLQGDRLKKLQQSVVLVEAKHFDGSLKTGNGFFGDEATGVIAKNRKMANVVFTTIQVFGIGPKFSLPPKEVHVIVQPGSAGEKRLPATLIGFDRTYGLALVDVQVADGISLPPPLPVVPENVVQTGSTLYALGYAPGAGNSHTFVSNEVKVGSMRKIDGEVPMMLLLGATPAFSGGPIIDQAGKVAALGVTITVPGKALDGLTGPTITRVVRGKIERAEVGFPMRQGKNIAMSVGFELIDPAAQMAELWAEWWLEDAVVDDDAPRIPPEKPTTDGPRQKAPLKREGGFARGAIEMPEPPPGKVLWIEARARGAAGQEIKGPRKVEYLERAANPEKVPLLCNHRVGKTPLQLRFRGQLQVAQQKLTRKIDASLIDAKTQVDPGTQQSSGVITFSKYHNVTVVDNRPDPQMPRQVIDIKKVDNLSIRSAADKTDFYTMLFTDPNSPSKNEGIIVQSALGIAQTAVFPMQMGVMETWSNNHVFKQVFPHQVEGERINLTYRYCGTDVRNGRKVAVVDIHGHFYEKSFQDFDPMERIRGVIEIDLAAMRVSHSRTVYRIDPTMEFGVQRLNGRGWMEIEITRDFAGKR